jgi:Family of unknown function (DUF6231)
LSASLDPSTDQQCSSPSEELISLLQTASPQRILCCSSKPLEPLNNYCASHQVEINYACDADQLADQVPCDLAIVTDLLENLSKDNAIQLLGSLRNYHAPQIWVLVADNSGWELNDFTALGFKRLQHYTSDDRKLASYGYHITSYNRKRSWNNPQYWANPENWGKYRW